METDTNPIDRSIAHLLFHRPSDTSMLPLDETMPLNSNVMVYFSEFMKCFSKVDNGFLLLVLFSGLINSRYMDQ